MGRRAWLCCALACVANADNAPRAAAAAVAEAAFVVVELDVDVDGSPHSLTVRRGDDYSSLSAEFAAMWGVPGAAARLVDAVEQAAEDAGETLSNQWLVVVASPTMPLTQETAAAALRRTLASAAGYENVVVACDGFDVPPLFAKGAARNVIISSSNEFLGVAATLNRALALVPARSIAAVVPWGARLRAGRPDVFAAFERRAKVCGGAVAISLEAQRPWLAAVLPALVLDAAMFLEVGTFDDGYLYGGGVAEWLDRAASRAGCATPGDGAAEVAALLADDFGPGEDFEGPVFDEASSKEAFDVAFHFPHSAPPAGDLQNLLQVDAALYDLGGGKSTERWWLRTHANDVRDRENEPVGVVATICVYDDVRFLAPLLRDLVPIVDDVLVLHATRPWYGAARPAARQAAAEMIHGLAMASGGKVSVVSGVWPSEEAQRNSALAISRALPGKRRGFVLIVDTDEFWHPVELDRVLALVLRASATWSQVGWARATMSTYFKSLRTVVTPPEPLRILWLVSLDSGDEDLDCFFSEARNWACRPSALGASKNLSLETLSTKIDASGSYVDAGLALCHHLSYVRTTAELAAKLQSFAHAPDVLRGWLEDVWLQWDDTPNMRDLHPTHPSAFQATELQPLWKMPPALRRLYIQALDGLLDGTADGETPPAAACADADAPAALYCRLPAPVPPETLAA
ncbi:hypothetical protein M885DRAFT_542428 [Pelagophyceae sp. CCMP2097]|nr:hypothetical protein M885DRAFT_542428 [Pelagophyceae sp. CCMP2097]